MQNQSIWSLYAQTRGFPLEEIAASMPSPDDDDFIVVIEDELECSGSNPCEATRLPWQILIADDDPSVHEVTVAALSGQHIHDRPLSFLHAYSATETVDLLKLANAIDLVLLDVVMESPNAGLNAVKTIRETLGMHELKIVIRTGQPGHAPEQEIRRSYAINGYAKKAELTRSLLHDVIASALHPSPPSNEHKN